MASHSAPSVRSRSLSLLLVLAMLVSLLILPSHAAQSPQLSVDNDCIELSLSSQSFTATLTVPASQVSGDAQTWAEGLDWYLTRTESIDAETFPYFYPGDALKNWQTWGEDGMTGCVPYFNVGKPVATVSGDTVTVTVTVTSSTPFFNKAEDWNNGGYMDGNSALESSGHRNVYGSFIGDYTLSARTGSTVVASTAMEVAPYKSYVTYDDTYNTLKEIQALAQAKGRYFEIGSMGKSADGRDAWYVVLSDSASSVSDYKTMNAQAITDPAAVKKAISADGAEYRIPFMISNVHTDECPGVDAQLNLLRELATADTISYRTLVGLKEGTLDEAGLWDPKVTALADGLTEADGSDYQVGLGSAKLNGGKNNAAGDQDASSLYNISDEIVIDVDELLDSLIILSVPTENPDGRDYGTRQNGSSFDLNRDGTYQTQPETQNLMAFIAQWNPVIFAELHGFMDEFLVEPCTPPHEPNLEYDMLVKNFLLGAEAFGKAALGTMSGTDYETKFISYYTPLRDDYDPETTTWSAWDDLCTNYGPSYAMLNCGSLGYTIETPDNTEASTRLLECGMYGLLDFAMNNKQSIYTNQLEFFQRGVENRDERDEMDQWYVDINNNQLDADTWRVPYDETDNFFPEYYVLPVDAASQRDPADVYALAEFLIRNGVEVRELTKDVTVDGTTYKAGSLAVNMYQAKRNYANCVLYTGMDSSASGFEELYSESVTNFPDMWGFDCYAVATKNAKSLLDAATKVLTEAPAGASQITNADGAVAVVLENNGSETVRAVNALLAAGKTVGMITSGDHTGDFVVSPANYESISKDYVLVATGVTELPQSYAISQPSLFVVGVYEPYHYGKVTQGYYSKWFSQGYGYDQYDNTYTWEGMAFDLETYGAQLGFQLVDDPAKATVIIGSSGLDNGAASNAQAAAAVKAGTPYIATGYAPLNYIASQLLPGQFAFSGLGTESLHTVLYPTADSLITASKAADEDYITYSYQTGYITQAPAGSVELIRATEKDSHIAGVCPSEDGKELDGKLEAISYEGGGLDLTIFANSIVNKSHQQDDYLYATNAIYAKSLSDTALTVEALNRSAYVGSFTDVPSSHWAADGIAYVSSAGLMTGTSSTTFAPLMTTNRAMIVTILWRQAGSPVVNYAMNFDDVEEGLWYSEAVRWAASEGIVTGYSDTVFAPDDTVTREQLATILCRYSDGKATGELSSFADGDTVSDWARDAMSWAVGEGLITGKDGNRLDPSGTASRAEVAVILYRLLG